MGVKEKALNVLSEVFRPTNIRLEDDDGITGYVVSSRFEGMSALDRQTEIDEALSRSLTGVEKRHVLAIAGLTPAEFFAVGPRTRIHRVRQLPGGSVEILLRGGHSDSEYVRGALKNKGVKTTTPTQDQGVPGFMKFRAGTKANPLTKDSVLQLLKQDQYIEVMAGV